MATKKKTAEELAAEREASKKKSPEQLESERHPNSERPDLATSNDYSAYESWKATQDEKKKTEGASDYDVTSALAYLNNTEKKSGTGTTYSRAGASNSTSAGYDIRPSALMTSDVGYNRFNNELTDEQIVKKADELKNGTAVEQAQNANWQSYATEHAAEYNNYASDEDVAQAYFDYYNQSIAKQNSLAELLLDTSADTDTDLTDYEAIMNGGTYTRGTRAERESYNPANLLPTLEESDTHDAAYYDAQLSDTEKASIAESRGIDISQVGQTLADEEQAARTAADDAISLYAQKKNALTSDYGLTEEGITRLMSGQTENELDEIDRTKASQQAAKEYTASLQQRDDAYYSTLSQNADYAEQSQYRYNASGDLNYERKNQSNFIKNLVANGREQDTSADFGWMSEEQLANYNYLYHTQGEEAAEAYYDYINRQHNEEIVTAKEENLTNYINAGADAQEAYNTFIENGGDPESEEGKALKAQITSGNMQAAGAYGLRAVLNVMGGTAGTVDTLYHYITGQELDPYSSGQRFSRYADDISETLQSSYTSKWFNGYEAPIIGNVGNFMYGVVTSTIDSSLNMGLAGAMGTMATGMEYVDLMASENGRALVGDLTSALMGSQVLTQSIQENIEAGYSDKKAVAQALVAAAIEGITEKYSVESILKDNGSVFGNLWHSFLAEGSEEVASDILNEAVNMFAFKDRDEIRKAYEQYIADGYSEVEAMSAAFNQAGCSLISSFLAGGLSGLGMSASTYARGGYQAQRAISNQGQYVRESGTVNALVGAAQTQAESSGNDRLMQLANEVAENEAKLKGATTGNIVSRLANKVAQIRQNARVGNLSQNLSNDLNQQAVDVMTESVAKISGLDESYVRPYMENAVKGDNATEEVKAEVNDLNARDETIGKKISAALSEIKAGETDIAKETTAKIDSIGRVSDRALQADAGYDAIGKMSKLLTSDKFGFSETTAEVFEKAFESTPYADQAQWSSDAATVLTQAKAGYSLDYITEMQQNRSSDLNNTQIKMLYEAGRAEMENATAAKQALLDKYTTIAKERGVTNKQGTVTIEESVAQKIENGQLTERQQAAIETLKIVTAAVGHHINIVDETDKYNGYYDSSTDTYEVAINAGDDLDQTVDGIVRTANHELVHYVMNWSPQAGQKFIDYLCNSVYTAEELEERIAQQMKLIPEDARKSKTVTEIRQIALEEVAADAMNSFLTDSKAIREFIAEQDKTAKKANEFLQKFTDNLNKAVSETDKRTPEAEILEKTADKYNQAVALFDDALRNARENYNAAKGIVEYGEVAGMTAAEVKEVTDGLAKLGIGFDAKTQSVAPNGLLLDAKTWNESDYVKARDRMAELMSKALDCSVDQAKKYIDDISSIAAIIGSHSDTLDYESAPGLSAFKTNTEYGGTIDFSTLCAKRRIYTGTTQAIQKALGETTLTPSDYLTIRDMMAKRGYQVPCGMCYVEGSRTNYGLFNRQFQDRLSKLYPNMYQPTMMDLNTADGIENLRITHPDVFDKYEYFYNHHGTLEKGQKSIFATQQKPKAFQQRTAYKGEILEAFRVDSSVDAKNANGGLRLNSFSDAEVANLLDYMQVILDMGNVGLYGQAYTKVEFFADFLAYTGLKINLSLVAKGVDENGKLICNDVEGMKYDTAMRLRDKGSQNVGTVVVVFNDAQLLAALADDKIDYVLPFHRSQWKSSQYESMGLPVVENNKKNKNRMVGVWDFTNQQNEKWLKPKEHKGPKGGSLKCVNLMPGNIAEGHGYWDFSKSGTENAKRYLEICKEEGRRPKFYKLLTDNHDGSWSLKEDGSTDGYWKLLIDFKMYDNEGIGSPQRAVRPDFDMDTAKQILLNYDEDVKSGKEHGHQSLPVANDIVNNFVKEKKAGRLSAKTKTSNQLYEEYTKAQTEYHEAAQKRREAMESEEYKALDSELKELFAKRKISDMDFRISTIDQVKSIKQKMDDLIEKAGDLNELYTTMTRAEEAYENQRDAERNAAEAEEIKASGKTEAQYFNDRAVKEFGYTPYFYDGAYMLANGKMLNFSGEKGQHFGMRGEDHRAIEAIFKTTRRGEALARFISYGNIRLMPESNSFEMTKAPTKEQELTLRKFIDQCKADYTNNSITVDFDTENGVNTQHSASYKIGTSSSRILSDIREYYEKGTVPKGTARFSLKNVFITEADVQEYNEAVKNGDMSKAEGKVFWAAIANEYKPVVRYHQTGEKFTKFNTGNPVAGEYDSETPNGIFFKANDHDIGVGADFVKTGHGGSIQMAVYLKTTNMLHFADREEAVTWYKSHVPGYAELDSLKHSVIDPLDKAMDQLEDEYYGGMDDDNINPDMSDEEFQKEWHAQLEELGKVEDSYNKELRSLLNDYFLNNDSGYDGIELDYDGHRFIDGKREDVHTFIVFDPSQAKSSDTVTYDDAGNVIPLNERFNSENDDIRFSLKAVPAVQPTSDEWQAGPSYEDVKEQFPQLWDITSDDTSTKNPTSVKITEKSYDKYFKFLKNEGFTGRILDASSGLGYGTELGQSYGFDIEDIEPYPQPGGHQPSLGTDYSAVNEKFDFIISNAVLNVMTQDQRDALVVKMGEMLNPGGRMVINVRTPNDIKNAKSAVPVGGDYNAWYIGSTGSYQKGFSYDELKAYLEDALGEGYSVSKTGFGGGVTVMVNKAENFDGRYSYKGVKGSSKQDSQNLAIAQEMLDSGIDSEKVRFATGWFKGYDGKWRSEIDDSGAKLKGFNFWNSELRREADRIAGEYFKKIDSIQAKIAELEDDRAKGKLTDDEYDEKYDSLRAEYRKTDNERVSKSLALDAGHTVYLSDILDHPRLYEAYPQLKHLKVKRAADLEIGGMKAGGANYNDGSIAILDNRSDEDTISTIMHEVQHEIQQIEGFARGSNPDYMAAHYKVENSSAYKKAHAELKAIEEKLKAIEYHGNISASPAQTAMMYAYISEQYRKDIRKNLKANIEYDASKLQDYEQRAKEGGYTSLLKEYQAVYDDIQIIKVQGESSGTNLYYRTAGEVEARDVEKRLGLTEEQRKATRPDIDRTDVVFAEDAKFSRKQQLTEEESQQLTLEYAISQAEQAAAAGQESVQKTRTAAQRIADIYKSLDGDKKAKLQQAVAELKETASTEQANLKAQIKSLDKRIAELEKQGENDRYSAELEQDRILHKYLGAAMENAGKLAQTQLEDAEQIREQAADYEAKMGKLEASLRKQIQTQKDNLEKLKAHNAEMRRKGVEQRRMTDMRNRIKNMKADLTSRILHPTENHYVPSDLVESTVAVLNAIDTVNREVNWDGTETKAHAKQESLKAALLNMQHEYDKLAKDTDHPELADEYDSGLSEALGNLADMSVNINDLTYSQLQTVYKMVKAVRDTVYQANRLIRDGENEDLAKVATKAYFETHSANRSQNKIGGKWENLLVGQALSPERAILHMMNYNEDAELVKLYKELNEGVRKANTFKMEQEKKFAQLTQTNEGRQHLAKAENVQIETEVMSNKGRLKLTEMQAMQIVMSWQREMSSEDKLTHLQKGGFIIPDEALAKKGDFKGAVANGQKVANVDQADIDLLKQVISPWGQQYMALAHDAFNGAAQQAINDTWLKVRHYAVATTKDYIPYKVDSDYVASDITGLKMDSTIIGSGAFKEIKKHAPQPIVIEGLSSVVDSHLDLAAKTYGLVIPIRNLQKVYNAKARNEDTGLVIGSMKEALNAKWGKNGTSLIENTIKDLQTSRETDRSDTKKMLQKLQGAWVNATLVGNLSVTIKQAASYPVASAYLSTASLAKHAGEVYRIFGNLNSNYAQELFKEIDQHTAAHYIRRQGLSSAELAIRTDSKKKVQTWADTHLEGAKNPYNWNVPTSLNAADWIQAMDVATTAALWSACKDEVEEHGTKADSEGYWEKVTELYNTVIENTQPMYDSLHRGEIQKSTDLLARSLVLFQTQPLQNSGLIWNAVGEYQAAKASKNEKATQTAAVKLKKVVGGQVTSAIVFALMTLLASMVRHKPNSYRDDTTGELTAASVWKEVGVDAANSLFNAAVPIFGTYAWNIASSISTAAQGGTTYDVFSVGTTEMMNDLVTDVDNLVKKPSWSKIGTLAMDTAEMFGIPTNNVYNTINGIRLNMVDLANGELGSFNAGYDYTNKQRYAQMANAYADGDTAKVKAIVAEMVAGGTKESTIKSGLTSTYKEQYINGTEAERKEIRKLLYATGLYENSDAVVNLCNNWLKSE